MKTYRLSANNKEEPLMMAYAAVPQPKRHEVVVKMAAASLNFRDYNIFRGGYPDPLPQSFAPVSDGAGIVVAIGDDVTMVAPGDRVATHFLPEWRDGDANKAVLSQTLGAPLSGVLSEYACVPERALIHFPSYLSDVEAATLPIAALTAWQAVVVEGAVNAASTVVVQGTGGVALFALQFAKMHGARVIVLSSSDEKIERAKALGADIGINYNTYPRWAKEVIGHTQEDGVDVVVDVVGMTINESLAAVKPGGIVCMIGLLEGYTPKLNVLPLLQYRKRIIGITVGSYAMFKDMVAAMTHHELHPVIEKIYSFDKAQEAYEHVGRGGQFGKIVIKIS